MSFWKETKACDLSEPTPDYSLNVYGFVTNEQYEASKTSYLVVSGLNLNPIEPYDLRIHAPKIKPPNARKTGIIFKELNKYRGWHVHLFCIPGDRISPSLSIVTICKEGQLAKQK